MDVGFWAKGWQVEGLGVESCRVEASWRFGFDGLGLACNLRDVAHPVSYRLDEGFTASGGAAGRGIGGPGELRFTGLCWRKSGDLCHGFQQVLRHPRLAGSGKNILLPTTLVYGFWSGTHAN